MRRDHDQILKNKYASIRFSVGWVEQSATHHRVISTPHQNGNIPVSGHGLMGCFVRVPIGTPRLPIPHNPSYLKERRFMTNTKSQAENYQPAIDHLSLIDEDWARLINLAGPCMHRSLPAREPYEALIRAVAYQQLHTRAADAIIARFLGMYPGRPFPDPNQILATAFDHFRACGFSTRKIETIKGIAEGALSGFVPPRDIADGMPDDELIARLIELPGIGRWTVEMLLIYTLERLDVMPADDFGVREGYRFLKSLDAVPNRREMENVGLLCSPYRTVAAWYLWRIPSLPGYTKKK